MELLEFELEDDEEEESGSTPMAVHMRANCARKDGSERMSLACVWANCCSAVRKTESWVSRASAFVARREEPCEA